MTAVDESWETKRSTIKERTAFLHNNELMNDVKFVVPASNDDNSRAQKKAKMEIPAHKFVLAISSPVFYATFYGQMAETTDSVELPDCEYESLLEFFRYLYSDKVNLNGNNVWQVFYLAKKYMVPSLADKCTKYLRDNLGGSNVFSILLHAQKFESKDLEGRCWAVIKTQARRALMSDEFFTLERSVVESVVETERLFVNVVELFKAVNCWGIKEIERQGLTPGGDIKRQILGEEIVKAIRFPLMSQKEFASVVPDCNILTMKEVGDMMKYYSDVLTTPLPFRQAPRVGPSQQCFRFAVVESSDAIDVLFGKSHTISVATSKTVFLHGVHLFGSDGGTYTVDIEVVEVSGPSLLKESGTFFSKKVNVLYSPSSVVGSRGGKKRGFGDDFYSYEVLFGHPVYLESGKTYKITSRIEGPPTWHGTNELESVECAGVTFTFNRDTGSLFGFKPVSWQFPALIFSL